MSASSVQELPSHCSFFVTPAGSGLPPKNKPSVLLLPAAAPAYLPLLISAISVQDVPFQDSTFDVPGVPPAATAEL